MRKLKKILAILTCALMGFTLAACSSKNKINEDALDAYAKAATNITKMKSAAYDMKLLVDADDMDMHAKVTMDGTYNAEKKLKLALHMDAAVNGIGLDDLASFYMKDVFPANFASPASVRWPASSISVLKGAISMLAALVLPLCDACRLLLMVSSSSSMAMMVPVFSFILIVF